MTTKVIMPQMGESIFEGTITKWLKKVGDTIARDEPLFEISTDKVDSEIPSPAAGTLSEILVPEGQTVQINTVVAVIEEGDKAAAQPEAKVAKSKGAAPPAAEAPPAEPKAETAAAAEPPPAEPPAAEAPPGEPEAATTAAAEPPTGEAPPAAKPTAVEKAEPVATEPEAEKSKTEPVKRPVAAPAAKTAVPVSTSAREIRASPLVRRLARENQVDLTRIHGTGLGGRITKQDISSYLDQETQAPAPPAEAAPARPKVVAPAPETPKPAEAPKSPQAPAPAEALKPPETPRTIGETESVPMTPMRKAIAEHMVLSRKTSAHVSTLFEVDMTSIVRLREKHKESFEAKEGIKLTYTPFFVKALVDAVGEFPIMNCSIAADNIVYHRTVNVGIAVALETGLIVPVVKDAQLKSFTGLALAIAQLAENARTKKLKPDDVKNGTITVTNPGVYGALFGTPIINQPQVAILGIGGIEKRPVVVNDAIAIRSMVYLSLSFDHRVIDGAVADQFMAKLKQRLQAWTVL